MAANVMQLYAVVCRLCALGKLRIAAVMLSLRFFNRNFNRSKVFLIFFCAVG